MKTPQKPLINRRKPIAPPTRIFRNRKKQSLKRACRQSRIHKAVTALEGCDKAVYCTNPF